MNTRFGHCFLWITLCCGVVLLLGSSMAAVSQSLPSTHKDHPGKCWETTLEKALDVDSETTEHKSCTRITCHKDFSLTYATCGVKAGDNGSCKLVIVPNVDYPDCCDYDCS